jgi:serine/threonine protein kinase
MPSIPNKHSHNDKVPEDLFEESDGSSETDESSDYSEGPPRMFHSGMVLRDNYILLTDIGKGRDNFVWVAFDIEKNNFVAVKIHLPLEGLFENAMREITILRAIKAEGGSNNNIISLENYFKVTIEDHDFACMVFELCAGSLEDILFCGVHKYGLPQQIIKKMLKQIVNGLNFQHNTMNLIHTDLKTANVLIKGISPQCLSIMNEFNSRKFNKHYEALKQSFAKKRMTKDRKELFSKKLQELALKFTQEMKSLRIEEHPDSASEESDDDLFSDDVNDDYVNDNDDIDKSDDSESSSDLNAYTYESDDDSNKKLNNRTQSIDDYENFLNERKLIDLEKKYKFDTVLNNKANSMDKNHVIDETFIENCTLLITDFGTAYYTHAKCPDEVQDRLVRAPEVILDVEYGKECDIWSLGCITFKMLTGFDLFDAWDDEICHRDTQHLFLIEKLLCPIPIDLIERSKRGKILYDEKRGTPDRPYHLRHVDEFDPLPVNERLMTQFKFSHEDADTWSKFLLFLLEVDPLKRPNIKQVKEHPLLN